MAEAYNGAGRALKALRPQYQAAIELTAKPGVPGVGSGRPGDTNFGGNAQGVTAESFIELMKAARLGGTARPRPRP